MSHEESKVARVLILTPIKNAAKHLVRYVELIERLAWPAERLSVAMLEGDSSDGTYDVAESLLPRLRQRASRAALFRRDFDFHLPAGVQRWAPAYQTVRRAILARARNHLLFRALDDEDWVLWIDVDVIDYPADVLERLIATGFSVVVPNCVRQKGGPTFDRNNWAPGGRTTLSDHRGQQAIRLGGVGGTMLLIRADLHRDGLVFPPYRYGMASPNIRPGGLGEIETEGLGMMCADMGVQCWGLPDLEIIHSDE